MRLSNSEDRVVVGVPGKEKYCFTFRTIVVMADFLRAVQVYKGLCLNEDKATGLDNVSTSVLKNCSKQLVEPLKIEH